MSRHPDDEDLALLAGGDAGVWQRIAVGRHVRNCAECKERTSEFEALRSETAVLGQELPIDLQWDSLAAEMRANIRLGLEAGACVATPAVRRVWNPRLVAVCASLLIVAAASILLRERPRYSNTQVAASPVAQVQAPIEMQAPTLAATDAGIELRTSPTSSLTLLSHNGAVARQTVNAGGEIRARYIDGETGAVTINNVYLQ